MKVPVEALPLAVFIAGNPAEVIKDEWLAVDQNATLPLQNVAIEIPGR
jgi:hypothetical protein